MATMLRHKDTGEIYPYNPSMALHEKMESFEPVPKEIKEATAKTRRGRKTAAQKTAEKSKAAAAAQAVEDAAAEASMRAPAEQEEADAAAKDDPPGDDLGDLEGLDDLDDE